MSDQISIIGIKGFGHHGVLDQERIDGQDFLVDLSLELSLQNLGDDLKNTVDYSKLIELTKFEITSNPVNLIETLAERIAEKIFRFDQKIEKITVTVHKPGAPVSAQITDISVSISKSR